jgi:hypothetical protein
LKSSWKYQVLSLVALAAMGVTHRAQAQTLLANGNSLLYNGLTYTISSCVYTSAGTQQPNCGSLSTTSLEGFGSGRGASIEVLNTDSTPVLSLASTAGATFSELSFVLTAVATSPTTTVHSVTDTLNGSGVAGYPTQVSAGVTSASTTPNVNLTTSLTNLTDSASFASFNPTAAAPLVLNVDLKVSTLAGNVGRITLTNATIQAPEPASIALFGTALTGIVAVRRRMKRPAQQRTC